MEQGAGGERGGEGQVGAKHGRGMKEEEKAVMGRQNRLMVVGEALEGGQEAYSWYVVLL